MTLAIFGIRSVGSIYYSTYGTRHRFVRGTPPESATSIWTRHHPQLSLYAMPRIVIENSPAKLGSDYPPPYDAPLVGRVVRDVAAAGGLTDFVANHVVIPPGGWSSQRHWHAGEDELVVILSGSAVLIDNDGRRPMAAGDVATFAKNDGNGHHLVNESDTPCVVIAVSLTEASLVTYSDIDLLWSPGTGETHKDGTPY